MVAEDGDRFVEGIRLFEAMRTSKAIGMPSQWPSPRPPISPIETLLGVHAGDASR